MTAGELPAADQARRDIGTVLTAMRELFGERDLSALDRYWAEPCVQHSPRMSSGLDTLRAAGVRYRGSGTGDRTWAGAWTGPDHGPGPSRVPVHDRRS